MPGRKWKFFLPGNFTLFRWWGSVITHGAQNQLDVIQAAVVKHLAVGLCRYYSLRLRDK
jgi:hypothetical protein